MQAARAETQPACSDGTGQLPSCGALAFPYVAVQGKDPVRYDDQEALRQGTLFPGLDLPFHKELRSRFPQVDGALLELMALDFAIDELGLYLTTHSDDQQALELYWSYIRLGQEKVSGAVRAADADGYHAGQLQMAQRSVAVGRKGELSHVCL